jgi:hypothetical protein
VNVKSIEFVISKSAVKNNNFKILMIEHKVFKKEVEGLVKLWFNL